MTPEQIKIAVGIILAGFLFACGWAAKGWKNDSETLAIERAVSESREAAAKSAAEAIAKIPQLTTKIYSQTNKSKVYTDCVHSDDVWQTIGEALK